MGGPTRGPGGVGELSLERLVHDTNLPNGIPRSEKSTACNKHSIESESLRMPARRRRVADWLGRSLKGRLGNYGMVGDTYGTQRGLRSVLLS